MRYKLSKEDYKIESGCSFNVDHCHKTGENRGLLCQHCNLLLGQCKDSVDILQKAIDYLGNINDTRVY
jgi:hypothetical protein